jgi:hypothetical protein
MIEKKPYSPYPKYDDLPAPVAPSASQQSPSVPTPPPFSIWSELDVEVRSLITYTTNQSTNSLVRVYDGVHAQRDSGMVVKREDIIGKTPEQIRDLFCLAFTPRYICDTLIPAGEQMAGAKLTNKAGKTMSVFCALTRITLSNERPL